MISYAVSVIENVRLCRSLKARLTIRLGTKILASSTLPGARLASTQISKKCSLGYELTSFLQDKSSVCEHRRQHFVVKMNASNTRSEQTQGQVQIRTDVVHPY